jgi:hypothetical protein
VLTARNYYRPLSRGPIAIRVVGCGLSQSDATAIDVAAGKEPRDVMLSIDCWWRHTIRRNQPSSKTTIQSQSGHHRSRRYIKNGW